VGEGTALDTSRASRRIIERPRLTRLLSESESRVMLLVAPAGYGKTTLARQWLSTAGRTFAWYQATGSSSDVAALALGLAKAAVAIIPGADDRLRAQLKAAVDPASDPAWVAKGLATEFSDWPGDVSLVVDDYHLLAASETAESFVEAFVAATSMPLLVASRERPSWVSAKKLLYGEVSEFGRTTLAMTHDEAAAVLSRGHEEMPGLVALAEGWPAVIGLAALLPSPMAHTTDDVPETLHEYFAEELYQGLDADLKWSLARLALAPTIDDSVALDVVGVEGARLLEKGFRAGFLSKGPSGYEMHPLLRQFLRTKIGDFPKEDVHDTVCALGAAYADNGYWDEAMSIAEEFGLRNLTIRVLENALDVALSDGRIATVERWLALARQAEPLAPIVALAEVEIAFRTGKVTTARENARQLVRTTSQEDPLASRVYLRAGQISHLDDQVQEALELFDRAEELARTPLDLRRALWNRFISLADLDDREGAARALEALESLPPLGGDDVLRASQARLQSALRWGGVTDAVGMAARTLELLHTSKDPVVRTGFLQSFGIALVLAARYSEAEDVAQREIAEAREFKLDWVVPHALELQSSAQVGQRNFQSALRTLSKVQQLAEGNAHTELNVDVLRARVHLSNGAPERAVSLLEGRETAGTSPGMQGDLLATLGIALICSGEGDKGSALLDASEAVTTHSEARTLSAFGRALASHFMNAAGSFDEDKLAHAFAVATQTGNFDAFVTAYRACPPLLSHLGVPHRAKFREVACSLDGALAQTFGLTPVRPIRQAANGLTRREVEILNLLRQGLSNRQIARTLWIAESTVKVHVRHIFEKLGVQSRTEAAALAADVL